MCAVLDLNSRALRPGLLLRAWREGEVPVAAVWAGFARSESLAWWLRKGGELVDVPAHRFAERSLRDGRLRWDEVPAGWVVRGFLELGMEARAPLLKVVTRASTAAELAHFEHPRMPLLELPLYSATVLEDLELAAQPELF